MISSIAPTPNSFENPLLILLENLQPRGRAALTAQCPTHSSEVAYFNHQQAAPHFIQRRKLHATSCPGGALFKSPARDFECPVTSSLITTLESHNFLQFSNCSHGPHSEHETNPATTMRHSPRCGCLGLFLHAKHRCLLADSPYSTVTTLIRKTGNPEQDMVQTRTTRPDRRHTHLDPKLRRP